MALNKAHDKTAIQYLLAQVNPFEKITVSVDPILTRLLVYLAKVLSMEFEKEEV